MKTLLLFPLLLMFVSPVQNPSVSQPGSPVTVLGFKCSRTHQNVKTPEPSANGPAAPVPEVNAVNKNSARNARANDPMGARDPTEDSIDSRSAAIEKSVRESRTPKTKATEGFAYMVKLQNAGERVTEFLFWEYQFIEQANPANVTRRQFLCVAKIKPGKEKELQAFGVAAPVEVINVGSLSNPAASVFQEKVLINRVEYVDGSVWQRKDWNSNEIKLTYEHALATPWEPSEMCRAL